jgi:hypothetical protein
MEETILKQIPCNKFFARLGRDALFEGFAQRLAAPIADQQQAIANLMTVDSEQRLGKTPLQLARTLGKKDPRSIRIELKISHVDSTKVVEPESIKALDDDADDILTLVTCYPFNFVGSAPKRFIVCARRIPG